MGSLAVLFMWLLANGRIFERRHTVQVVDSCQNIYKPCAIRQSAKSNQRTHPAMATSPRTAALFCC